ncbi:MAG: riboflavin biosynthesis protein RibF [Candidatus Marinimicrobia bacterium]|jgi:riboflavin kinase/FMN adenylyltransferase|nr:riboflavin biosynthesis protein RibF [Candidatus Neomarinimicrobiota bacterium]MBT4317212.1 riboflavin biosynthesis protein RibF [Candidatus Neomarinimicrobiota bacterium]MBT4706508.1 riboflavin biosynthesis protein RibF [Candidatus Neomarinimicrobiota bacterium]MBT4926382.1 riboflavin biosynthesis protein RibF [Candidatus Neomarinimicrobiota bacterium]MBT5251091.1 riboflavin biosynthesis protein RibF [Candidatus Neomarinimicrobiota bacterium]
MEVLRSIEDMQPLESSVITVGNYDGIHLGHQDVLNHIVKIAKKESIPSCLITFDPNPAYILSNNSKPMNLQDIDSKLEMLEQIGIDKVLVIPFTLEFSHMSAEDFSENIIKKLFNPKLISVGENHYFGFQKRGDLAFLTEFCNQNNIELYTPEIRTLNDKPISSTLTRGLIRDGILDQVPSLLGKFYGFNVLTVHGSNRGKSMNYPTANFIPLSEYQMIPEGGVYLSKVFLDGEKYFGMTNIGYRPTFNEKKFVMEVHILSDKFSDLYDKRFYIEFLNKIRNEIKFESKEDLIKQIENDKEVCIKLIDSFKEKYEV